VLVLCVKPQAAAGGLPRAGAARCRMPAPLVISIMAGVTEASIARWLGADVGAGAQPCRTRP
jgi:pyrroline-5-carboxylate reductase